MDYQWCLASSIYLSREWSMDGGPAKWLWLCHLLLCLAVLQRSLGVLATAVDGNASCPAGTSCRWSFPSVLFLLCNPSASGALLIRSSTTATFRYEVLIVLALVARKNSLNTLFLLERWIQRINSNDFPQPQEGWGEECLFFTTSIVL